MLNLIVNDSEAYFNLLAPFVLEYDSLHTSLSYVPATGFIYFAKLEKIALLSLLAWK